MQSTDNIRYNILEEQPSIQPRILLEQHFTISILCTPFQNQPFYQQRHSFDAATSVWDHIYRAYILLTRILTFVRIRESHIFMWQSHTHSPLTICYWLNLFNSSAWKGLSFFNTTHILSEFYLEFTKQKPFFVQPSVIFWILFLTGHGANIFNSGANILPINSLKQSLHSFYQRKDFRARASKLYTTLFIQDSLLHSTPSRVYPYVF